MFTRKVKWQAKDPFQHQQGFQGTEGMVVKVIKAMSDLTVMEKGSCGGLDGGRLGD